MITVYLLADVGSIGGGWLSSRLLEPRLDRQRRPQDGHARLRSASCPVVDALARPDSPWIAVCLIGIAAAAHQGFSANLFTLTSDMFPRTVVGSIVGIGGFAGAMGGFLMNLGAGRLKDMTGNYVAMFADRRLRLPGRPGDHPPAGAAAGTVPRSSCRIRLK